MKGKTWFPMPTNRLHTSVCLTGRFEPHAPAASGLTRALGTRSNEQKLRPIFIIYVCWFPLLSKFSGRSMITACQS